MNTTKIDFGEFQIVDSELSSTDASFTIAPTKNNRKGQDLLGVPQYYDFPDLSITNFRVTIEEKGGSRKEKIGISTVADASNPLSDGRKRYTLTIRNYSDGTTKMRGIKQDSDGTNNITNYDPELVCDSFPVGSLAKIVWDTDEQELLFSAINAVSEINQFVPQPTANGTVVVGAFYLNSSGEAVSGVNSGGFDGVNTIETTTGNQIAGVKYKATGIVVPGSIGDDVYAENSGALTSSPSGNTWVGRKTGTSELSIFNSKTSTEFSDNTFKVFNDADATKELDIDLSGATTGKKVTIKSDHTDDRTVTLPDVSGIVLSENKAEVENNMFKIKQGTNSITFSSTTLTADRTVSFPDADVSLADINNFIARAKVLTGTISSIGNGSGFSATGSVTLTHGYGATPSIVVPVLTSVQGGSTGVLHSHSITVTSIGSTQLTVNISLTTVSAALTGGSGTYAILLLK
jgi:hypothetical protein